MRPVKIPRGKINRNCASRGRCAHIYKGDSQYEDNKLDVEQSGAELPKSYLLGTVR